MATPINYGVSDQALAQAAANTFAAQTGQSLDAMKNEFNTKVAELGASIVSGINPAERSVLEKQVQDLGNRYSQSLSATQGQYAFAQQQGQATNLAVQSELAKAQDTARALAAQSLGQAGAPTIGGMTSAQLDAINAARQTGAAQLAYLGGEAAVPAGMQISPGAGQLGVSGISALSQQLSQNALLASQARSRAELENSRTNLETSLQAQALSAAAAREEAQREQLRTFELQGFRELLNARQAYDAKNAELLAKAASSDTRSGKDKALAELDFYRQKAAIDLKNSLASASASSRSPAVSQQANDLAALTIGSASRFGKVLSTAIANKPQSAPPATAKLTKAYAVTGVPGAFWMNGNIVNYNPKPTDPKSKVQSTNVSQLLNELSTQAGYALGANIPVQQLSASLSQSLARLNPLELNALKYVLGTSDPANLAQIIVSAGISKPTSPTKTTKPKK